jgi:two-component system phosphate regulon response regulator OmpR
MNKKHILIVDDDAKMRQLLGKYLQTNGFLTTEVHDTQEAREALDIFQFDLILLDIMLPNESGIEFAKKLREVTSTIAILMLSAMEDPKSRVLGLKSGADDYLSKPFEPQELVLRITKLIDRASHARQDTVENFVRFGQVKYDIQKNIFAKGEQIIKATDQEKKLLKILLANPGMVIDRDELAQTLKVNSRSIDVQIKRLRNKIESSSRDPVFLQSVRGKGYILYSDS